MTRSLLLILFALTSLSLLAAEIKSGEGILCGPAAVFRPSQSASEPPPLPHFNVRSHGAKGDGTTYDTVAIQAAIDSCAGSGGSVILPEGKYLSAQLTLKGRITFYLAKGAVLLGGTDPRDYPVLLPEHAGSTVLRRSLLFADKADNLVIGGEGEIDGQCTRVRMYGREGDRPSLIRIFNSDGIIVRDVTLRNPRMWTQCYIGCSNLLIDRVTVMASPDCPNLDGMDICDCHDVVIRNCDIASEDDSVCLKSHNAEGLRNIRVENNRILSFRANAIKLGTASVGPVSHLLFTNNVILGAMYGGLCIESVDGSKVSDVRVNGLEMVSVGQPLFIRLDNRKVGSGDLLPSERKTGSIDDVVIENLRAVATRRQTGSSCSITGIPTAKVGSVILRDCCFEMPGGRNDLPAMPDEKSGGYPQSNIFKDSPASGLFIRHAGPVKLENVEFRLLAKDARPTIVTNVADLRTNGAMRVGGVFVP